MIVYISGPYSAPTPEGIDRNIHIARHMAIRVWEAGLTALCPHLNTAHFEEDCKGSYVDFMRGDIELLEKCDAVLMLPGWDHSKGAIMERNHALIENIPVFYKIEELLAKRNA